MTEDRTKNLETLKMYTLTEIEPILGVTHRTLLDYVKTGRLKAVKLGGKWKISEENLRSFLNGEKSNIFTANDNKLLNYLRSQKRENTVVTISLDKLVKELNLSKPAIHTSLGNLIDKTIKVQDKCYNAICMCSLENNTLKVSLNEWLEKASK